jgi:hypothetical protein
MLVYLLFYPAKIRNIGEMNAGNLDAGCLILDAGCWMWVRDWRFG